MKKFSRWILYVVFFVGATLFFLYYLFPSEKVKEYIKRDLNRGYPDFTVDIQQLKPTIPPGLKWTNATLFFQNHPLFDAEKITFLPKAESFFRPGVNFSYKGDVHNGVLDGKMDIKEIVRPRNIRVDSNFSDIQLAQVPAVSVLYNVKISGRLNGKIKYSENELISNITAALTVTDGAVTLPEPFFEIEAIDFKNIRVELNMTNQRLIIKQLVLHGSQLEGYIAGSVKIKRPIQQSTLNFRGTLRPHRVFLADLKNRIPAPLFPKKRSGANSFSIRISGTFEQPNLSFR